MPGSGGGRGGKEGLLMVMALVMSSESSIFSQDIVQSIPPLPSGGLL